jgi:hypothetical protein
MSRTYSDAVRMLHRQWSREQDADGIVSSRRWSAHYQIRMELLDLGVRTSPIAFDTGLVHGPSTDGHCFHGCLPYSCAACVDRGTLADLH